MGAFIPDVPYQSTNRTLHPGPPLTLGVLRVCVCVCVERWMHAEACFAAHTWVNLAENAYVYGVFFCQHGTYNSPGVFTAEVTAPIMLGVRVRFQSHAPGRFGLCLRPSWLPRPSAKHAFGGQCVLWLCQVFFFCSQIGTYVFPSLVPSQALRP